MNRILKALIVGTLLVTIGLGLWLCWRILFRPS